MSVLTNIVRFTPVGASAPPPPGGVAILRGVATIPATEDSVTVAPPVLGYLQRRNIQVTPASEWSGATEFHIANVSGEDGTFDIMVDDTVHSDVDFVWWVIAEDEVANPLNLRLVEVGPGSVTLAWDRVHGADAYVLYWSLASGEPYEEWRLILLSELDNVALPTWTVEDLEGEVTHYFVVTSVQYAGPPAAPVLGELTEEGGVVSLEWNANSDKDLAGFRIYRSTTEGSGHTLIDTVGPEETTYDDTEPEEGETNYYYVTAIDAFGGESAPSNEESVFVGEVAEVELVAATAVTYGSGASISSISRTVPASTEEGDMIIACLFHRAGAGGMTAPTGFTRQAQHKSPSFDQWTEVWVKEAGAADAATTATFTGSSAGRMGLILMVLRAPHGVEIEDQASAGYNASANPGLEVVPTVTSGGPGRLWLGVAGCVYSATSGSTTYEFPFGWSQHTPTSTPASPAHEHNRLAVATRSVGAGATGTATVSHGTSATNHDAGLISIVLAPAEE